MKPDEKVFFTVCYLFCRKIYTTLFGGGVNVDDACATPRNVIALMERFIAPKRAHYLLQKWLKMGFYNYGVTLDMGWFEVDNLPDRYRHIVQDIDPFLQLTLLPIPMRREIERKLYEKTSGQNQETLEKV